MDIVERLRNRDICPCENFSHQTAIDEAAEEIERLREALNGTACNCPNVDGDEYEEGDECFCDAQYELQENCPYLKARSALQKKG